MNEVFQIATEIFH